MTKDYPKVVILYETFRSNSGGGITLSNLFKDWPQDRIANIVDGKMVSQITENSICTNFYQLGENERYTHPLFALFTTKFPSGKYNFITKIDKTQLNSSFSKKRSLKNMFSNFIWKFFKFMGLFYFVTKYKTSSSLLEWLDEFEPDIIYSQLSNYELIPFTSELKQKTNALLAVHVMDDWFSEFKTSGILQKYWQKKLNIELNDVLSQTDIFLSISDGMSEEYFKRYNKKFIPFHNPIDIDLWLPYTKADGVIPKKEIDVLYAGRIGKGTSQSVIELAIAIDELNNDGLNINLKIQTTSIDSRIQKALAKYKCVKFNPVVLLKELPKIFSSADILVMPIDFTEEGIRFLKYSMPTKASEYMISGTPILLYCHPDVSLFKHAEKHKWAFIVSKNDKEKLKKGLLELINNESLRKSLSNSAVNFSKMQYDSKLVREKFRIELNNHCEYKII